MLPEDQPALYDALGTKLVELYEKKGRSVSASVGIVRAYDGRDVAIPFIPIGEEYIK